MLTKEDIVPFSADHALHFLAPLVLTVPVWLAFAVLPFGRNMAAIDLDAGILFFFAIGSASDLSVFMAGWSSQNKYSLIGAMRAIAQMISYEVPLVLATVPVLMLSGSLSLTDIVQAQGPGQSGAWSHWYVFTPWGLAAFGLFLIAASAESNRSPFDLPEGESEIIAGYLTEYSGFKYACFSCGEYLGLFAVTGLSVTLFLGGWQAPATFVQWFPSWGRVRPLNSPPSSSSLYGQGPPCPGSAWINCSLSPGNSSFRWPFLISWPPPFGGGPLPWQFAAASLVRWLLCGAFLAAAYVALGRGLKGLNLPPRRYDYAV